MSAHLANEFFSRVLIKKSIVRVTLSGTMLWNSGFDGGGASYITLILHNIYCEPEKTPPAGPN